MSAQEILLDLLRSYKPEWHYEMGKVGYHCNFCNTVIKVKEDFYNSEYHADDCPLLPALEWQKKQQEEKA